MDKFTRIAALALVSVAMLNVAAVSQAADTDGVAQAAVKFGDLAVSNPLGAEVLYHRIAGAARSVCHALDDRSLAGTVRFQACVYQAVAEAVSKVDQPTLTAFYNAKHPQSATAIRVANR